MAKRLRKELVDQPLHIALTAPLLLIGSFPDSWWSYAVVAFWIGLLREDAQHRKQEGLWWLLPWEKRIYFDDVEMFEPEFSEVGGYRRWLDVLVTTAGGAIVGAVVEVWG